MALLCLILGGLFCKEWTRYSSWGYSHWLLLSKVVASKVRHLLWTNEHTPVQSKCADIIHWQNVLTSSTDKIHTSTEMIYDKYMRVVYDILSFTEMRLGINRHSQYPCLDCQSATRNNLALIEWLQITSRKKSSIFISVKFASHCFWFIFIFTTFCVNLFHWSEFIHFIACKNVQLLSDK